MQNPTNSLVAAIVAMRNITLGGNLASLRLLGHPTELVNYASENLFSLRSREGRGLPQKNVFEIFPAATDTSIRLSHANGGSWFHIVPSYGMDIVSLCLLCRALQPNAVFEIGTLHGYTAHHFALNTPDDCEIYTLDLPVGAQPVLTVTAFDAIHVDVSSRRVRYCWDRSETASKIKPLYGDSATFDYSPFWSKVDLFFIDGAHSYEYVRSDTLNAIKCVRPGGVIAWHDYGRFGVNGVSRWLHEFSMRGHEIYRIPGGSLAFGVF